MNRVRSCIAKNGAINDIQGKAMSEKRNDNSQAHQ
jgi:hypothetical protein